MTVLKLSKNKKSVLIYDDEGRCYVTSVVYLQGLLMGKSRTGFVMTKRLPFNASPGRFKPSELYDPEGIFKGDAAKTLTTANDALSVKEQKKKESKKAYTDVMVWDDE
jgi:hypothetical protein